MSALYICSLQQGTVLQGAHGMLALGGMHLAADRIHRLIYRVQWWRVDDGSGERAVNSRVSYPWHQIMPQTEPHDVPFMDIPLK
jgi:hypothetical protein